MYNTVCKTEVALVNERCFLSAQNRVNGVAFGAEGFVCVWGVVRLSWDEAVDLAAVVAGIQPGRRSVGDGDEVIGATRWTLGAVKLGGLAVEVDIANEAGCAGH